MRRVVRRIALVLVGAAVLWLVACVFLFVWPRADAAPAHADAVVVLSGGLNSRLDPALELMRRQVAPVLAISGALQDRRWKKARALCGIGRAPIRVPFRVVCFEPHPFSTVGEARAVAQLARAHDWHRVVVVTSIYHTTRARMLFHRCYPGRLWVVGTSTTWWHLPEEWAFETGKLVVQSTVERSC